MSGILTRLFERRGHPSSAATAALFDNILGGNWRTASGVTVTPQSSLQVAAVFACVRLLSETVATLPLISYRRLASGGKDRATKWSLYSVLRNLPNPEMSAVDFWGALESHIELWGNAYAEKEMDRAGRVKALWPLRPDSVLPERNETTGRLEYSVIVKDGQLPVIVPAERILHIRGFGTNGLYGLSVIQQARQAIGLSLAAEEFGARFFGNGAIPGIVLTHPGKIGPEARKNMKDSWKEQHEGLQNAQRLSILEEGVKVERIGIPPNDSQFLETRRFQLAEVARMFAVPLHMLAEMMAGASYASVEQRSLEFLILSLRPRLVRIEQAVYRSLMTEAEREEFFTEFLVDGLLRGDIRSRYAAYSAGRQWGWLSINDVRALENMNPIDGDGGNEYLKPLNMADVNAVDPMTALAAPEQGGKGNANA